MSYLLSRTNESAFLLSTSFVKYRNFQCLKIQIGHSFQGITVWEVKGLSNAIIQELNFNLKKGSAVVLNSLEMGVLSFEQCTKLGPLTMDVTRADRWPIISAAVHFSFFMYPLRCEFLLLGAHSFVFSF